MKCFRCRPLFVCTVSQKYGQTTTSSSTSGQQVVGFSDQFSNPLIRSGQLLPHSIGKCLVMNHLSDRDQNSFARRECVPLAVYAGCPIDISVTQEAPTVAEGSRCPDLRRSSCLFSSSPGNIKISDRAIAASAPLRATRNCLASSPYEIGQGQNAFFQLSSK